VTGQSLCSFSTFVSIVPDHTELIDFASVSVKYPCEVCPCHHGMARPQVAAGGTASDMEKLRIN
jgi:hypothetical protein